MKFDFLFWSQVVSYLFYVPIFASLRLVMLLCWLITIFTIFINIALTFFVMPYLLEKKSVAVNLSVDPDALVISFCSDFANMIGIWT